MDSWHRLIRESLAALQTEGEDHPPAEQLAAFSQRHLPRRRWRAVAEHLTQCASCRARVVSAMPAPAPRPQLSRQWATLAASVVLAAAALVARGAWGPGIAPPSQPAPPAAPVARYLRLTPEARAATQRALSARPSTTAVASRAASSGRVAASLPLPAPSVATPAPRVTAASGFVDQPRLTQPALTARASMPLGRAGFIPASAPAAAAPTDIASAFTAAPSAPRAPRFTIHLSLVRPSLARAAGAARTTALDANGWAGRESLFAPSLWRVTPRGALEASPDGKMWFEWPYAPVSNTAAVAAVNSRVWIASGATIYYSSDAGAHWQRLAQLPPQTVVRSLVFDDAAHGSLLTADGHSWLSRDGGRSWQAAK